MSSEAGDLERTVKMMASTDDAPQSDVVYQYEGIYGGRNSRDEIIRALKEALALIEDAPYTEFVCTSFRIEGIQS
jgi:hypothetical protein